ncbi:MAG TPA: DUF3127 domain-containing protein [Bacteroidales bacterium]|nr:DUF3127 domain-containing protein [Bacteroidales bacterium]
MLELSGKLIQILPLQSGNGKNGTWQKQDFVIETTDQYPKKVCFSAWADKADVVKTLNPGTMVKVAFNAESREFNGKWYTDLRIWKIETAGGNNMNEQPGDEYYKNLVPPAASDLEPTPDDLPF